MNPDPRVNTTSFPKKPLPERFCYFDRLMELMEIWNLDGLVISSEKNIFYLSGFNPIAHKSDEPRPYALVLSRYEPGHPILLVADYYLGHFASQPSWVKDIRPVRAVMLPKDLPPSDDDLERFLPHSIQNEPWVDQARDNYASSMISGCKVALQNLGLEKSRVGFDELRLAKRIGPSEMQVEDAYDVMMQTRKIKTETELKLLQTATDLNEKAITQTVNSWQKGMSWKELGQVYHESVTQLGGFIHDPGGMVLAHPTGQDPGVWLQTGFEDFVIEEGTHVMFDCHGTWNQYCWDGGKTWIVEDDVSGSSALAASATAEAMRVIEDAMRPGTSVTELQRTGREVYRKMGVSRPESVLIFFHGLGLSHMDLEEIKPDGTPLGNWVIESGMVIATHLLWPGGAKERIWLEDVALVGKDGADPFFGWDFDPITAF